MLTDLYQSGQRGPGLCDATDAPVTVHQNRWEWQQLRRLYHQCRPARVLEVGTFHGGTLWGWLQADWPVTVVAVDTFTVHDGRAQFQQWAQGMGHALHTIQGDSRAPATAQAAAAHGPYDWVFIDADHGEAAVRADWAAYAPLCRPGGLVLLHDINARPGYGVSVLWRELQQAGYVTQEINARAGDPHPCGIGVVQV